MIGGLIAILGAVFLLSLVALITLVVWALIGPVGTVLVYGLIAAIIMIIRSSRRERVRRICEELGITQEEYQERLIRAEQEAAAAEWRSLSKGEKISRRLKHRYWETWDQSEVQRDIRKTEKGDSVQEGSGVQKTPCPCYGSSPEEVAKPEIYCKKENLTQLTK